MIKVTTSCVVFLAVHGSEILSIGTAKEREGYSRHWRCYIIPATTPAENGAIAAAAIVTCVSGNYRGCVACREPNVQYGVANIRYRRHENASNAQQEIRSCTVSTATSRPTLEYVRELTSVAYFLDRLITTCMRIIGPLKADVLLYKERLQLQYRLPFRSQWFATPVVACTSQTYTRTYTSTHLLNYVYDRENNAKPS